MNFLRQLLTGIAEAWGQLSASARVNIALAAVFAIALVGFVTYLGASPQYVTLSSDVASADASRIIEVLGQNGIRFKEQGGYQQILVPLEDRSRAQLLLADNDLPVGRSVAPGFELFQQNELMTNQWLQDVKFMRAVQGEAQRLLNQFDFIEYSYVLIREAKEELFRDEQKDSEAAVTLKTRRSLNALERKAIVSLVARIGGPTLSENNITITTTEGEVIWMPPPPGFASLASSKIEITHEWEQQREQKILSKLRELGVPGTVSVSAQMNFDEVQKTTEQMMDGAEIATMTKTTEMSTRENPPQGEPGAFANVPEAAAAPGGVTTQETTEEEIVNSEPSRILTTTTSGGGDVLKYNVALVVQGDLFESGTDDEGNPTRTYSGISEKLQETCMNLARAAVGSDDNVTITVSDHPFDIAALTPTTESMTEAAQAQRWSQFARIGWNLGQLLLILIGFMLVRGFLQRAMAGGGEEEEPAPVVIPEATREDMRRHEVTQEVSRLAREEPETVALLLRSWMVEEED